MALNISTILNNDTFDSSSVILTTLSPPNDRKSDEKVLAFTLRNVLSAGECAALIALTEQHGYDAALLNVGGVDEYRPNVRKSDRLILDSEEFVSALWERLSPLVPHTFKGHRVVGLNERLRFLRYTVGDYFRPHADGVYARPDGSALSMITLQIYLNDGFAGGETTFLSGDGRQRLPVVPETGMILVFEHRLYHEGSIVTAGQKYTVRTEVMYKNYKI